MSERTTERLHPRAKGLHSAATADVCACLLDAQVDAIASVRPALPMLSAASEVAAQALRAGHRLGFAGAGSSGLMALAECLELPGTFGIDPDRIPMLFAGGAGALLRMSGAVEDDPALAWSDLQQAAFRTGDVVICVSASGETPYTVAVAKGVKAGGAQLIGLSNVAGSALLELADYPVFLDTGPEVIAGSTRMGAATAQKVVLNMLSVLIGIKLGHVHDGYMVNLLADNAKLMERAARIVAAISGQGPDHARKALVQSAGIVKPAVLIALGATPEQATTQLKASGGYLDRALASLRTN